MHAMKPSLPVLVLAACSLSLSAEEPVFETADHCTFSIAGDLTVKFEQPMKVLVTGSIDDGDRKHESFTGESFHLFFSGDVLALNSRIYAVAGKKTLLLKNDLTLWEGDKLLSFKRVTCGKGYSDYKELIPEEQETLDIGGDQIRLHVKFGDDSGGCINDGDEWYFNQGPIVLNRRHGKWFLWGRELESDSEGIIHVRASHMQLWENYFDLSR